MRTLDGLYMPHLLGENARSILCSDIFTTEVFQLSCQSCNCGMEVNMYFLKILGVVVVVETTSEVGCCSRGLNSKLVDERECCYPVFYNLF